MLHVALSVDRNGVLNSYSMDSSLSNDWQGPTTLGGACLLAGSRVAMFQYSASLFFALIVDMNGFLNTAELNTADSSDWQGLYIVGNADFLPGAPIAVFQQSASVITALLVDRNGVLNAFSLTIGAAQNWQGPITIGGACLAPGTPVSVVSVSETRVAALMMDLDGVLNTAVLDASDANGWQGPDTVGNSYFLSQSFVSVA